MEKIQNLMQLDEKDIMDLKNNFIRASKNENFQMLLKTIPDIGEEVYMKYTSLLEDASCELENCLNCKHLSSCKNQNPGYRLTPKISGKEKKHIQFEYITCPKLLKKLEEDAYLDNIELFQVPKSLRLAKISDIKTDDKERLQILRYFKKFLDSYDAEEKPKGLYLNGSFGTGKTYLIASLFNELAKRGIRSALVYYPEFLRSLKESFDTDYKEKFQYIKKVPVLLLDDIGAEVVSSWGRDEILGSILQYRMEENLPTFFTSNLNLEELEEHLALSNRGVEKVKARRILERIKFMTIDIQIISKNRRN